MQSSAPFRLNRSAMLAALISAAFAGNVEAAAARVDFTTTGVTVAGRDGRARPLAKGAELDTGDTVRTSVDGRAQLRFTDGSYVSLQPNTDFAISDYKYEGKADDRGFFGLVRGAMRTVTGAVGRVNRNSYRITTPTATVGIRGTGGIVQILPGGETLVIGTSGIWSLTNPAGSIDIPAGISGLAPTDPKAPPRETNTQPQTSTAPAQPLKTEFKKGDEVDEEGKSEDLAVATETVILPKPVLVSGPGFQRVSAFTTPGSPNPTPNVKNENGSAVFDGAGQMLSHNGPMFQPALLSGGSHAEFKTDGILAWGRWVGPVQLTAAGLTQNYGPNSGFHYVVGAPTAAIPASGTANYSMIGGTRPTDGSVVGVLTSATLAVNFNPGLYRVDADIKVTMGGQAYGVAGWTTNGGSVFSISSMSNPTTITGPSGTCSSGCSALIQGFFAGASAERAGVGYHISNGREILGAAALKKD